MTSDRFGVLLRDWRKRRGLSQLQLSLEADVSIRHLSFMECGRAKPSRAMVFRLCDRLDIPQAAVDSLLMAAGHAHAFGAVELDNEELAPFRAAVAWNLRGHEPYPAMAVDGQGVIVDLNCTATKFFRLRGITKGDNFVRYATDVDKLKADFENWQDVLQSRVAMMQATSEQEGGHELFDELLANLRETVPELMAKSHDDLPANVPMRLKFNGRIIAYNGIRSKFTTVTGALMRDMTMIHFYPLDEACREFFLALAKGEVARGGSGDAAAIGVLDIDRKARNWHRGTG